MFDRMSNDPDFQADQWKIYPCEVTPWTVIKQWFDAGTFVPYADELLFEVILRAKAAVKPWVRLNRVVRDIPSQYILGGVDAPNMRQTLTTHLAARGLACACIRCREAGAAAGDLAAAARLTHRVYEASGGVEHFLSFETADGATIFGFVRLRLCDSPGTGVFPCLRGAGLIRELHVYGQLVPTAAARSERGAAQHTGFGRALMLRAEQIAAAAGYTHTAVIAGIGTRGYYRKLGYALLSDEQGGFMLKALPLSMRLRERMRARFPAASTLLPLLPVILALLLLALHVSLPGG